jgi:hypothetical protein
MVPISFFEPCFAFYHFLLKTNFRCFKMIFFQLCCKALIFVDETVKLPS